MSTLLVYREKLSKNLQYVITKTSVDRSATCEVLHRCNKLQHFNFWAGEYSFKE